MKSVLQKSLLQLAINNFNVVNTFLAQKSIYRLRFLFFGYFPFSLSQQQRKKSNKETLIHKPNMETSI